MTTTSKTTVCLTVDQDKTFVQMVQKVVYWETDKVHMNQFTIEEKQIRTATEGIKTHYVLWVTGVSLAQGKKMETFANGVVAGYREARKNLVRVA